jgi:4-hydroxy-2-oxoheptanedioate aldolase
MPNALKALWQAGGVAHGAWLSIPSTISAELVARTGFDYACIDLQHGLVGYETAVQMLQALDLGASAPVVRVPWNEPGIIGRMLDAGAMSIIVPMVNSPAEARAAVAACRYAPAGARSFGPLRPFLRDGARYYGTANAEVACIPMIETAQAVAGLDAILDVPGIDAVYVGPADLSITLGLPPGNNDDRAEFVAALERIVAACRARGIVPGIHASAALAARRREMGFRMITVSADQLALGDGVRADLRLAREGVSGTAGGGRVY